MNREQKIDFSIGSLFKCLNILPYFKSANKYFESVEKYCNISNSSFYNLNGYKANFITNECSQSKVSIFAQALVLGLLENSFYCKNDMEIAEFFLDDLKNILNISIEDIHEKHQQYLITLMEWPTCASIRISKHKDYEDFINTSKWQNEWKRQFHADNISKEAMDFWITCYYCIERLFEEALWMDNNIKDNEEFLYKLKVWTREIKNYKNANKEYVGQPLNQRFLRDYYLKKYIIKENKSTSEPELQKKQIEKSVGLTQLRKIFSDIKTNVPSLELTLNKKDFRIGDYQITDSEQKKRRISFQEIVNPPKDIAFRRNMFKIDIEHTPIDITNKGIERITENYIQLWVNKKIDSARNSKYKPISYRKVHIKSFYKENISPGKDEFFNYKMVLCPIEYFDHLIVRDYFNGKNVGTFINDREKFIIKSGFSAKGFEQSAAFFFLAGCGVWVISKDNYLIVSSRNRQGQILEKPGNVGYSAAGSCEYSSRFEEDANVEELEADPFKSAARELNEECNIETSLNDLTLVSFGIDYDRFLEQFSFYYISDESAEDIIENSVAAKSNNEQDIFAIPFTYENITKLIDGFEMEPGAIVSLIRLWDCLKV